MPQRLIVNTRYLETGLSQSFRDKNEIEPMKKEKSNDAT